MRNDKHSKPIFLVSFLFFCFNGYSQMSTNITKYEDDKRLHASYPPIVDDFSNNLIQLKNGEA